MPHNITARPTTDFAKENIFNVLENLADFEDKTACDLFSGTGAIALEFLSRGCSAVTAVEKSPIQTKFIKSVTEKLGDGNLHIVKGDVFKFIEESTKAYDFVFADPPYDHPRFEEIPEMVLGSNLVKPGTIFIMEHSAARDFSSLPGFNQRRAYGSVNFSIFIV